MSTYSVYNIHIDNNLSFTPGATVGSVLAIDANGNTSWVPQSGGSGGSQTLEQTLALGNDVGTYSIVGATISISSSEKTEIKAGGYSTIILTDDSVYGADRIHMETYKFDMTLDDGMYFTLMPNWTSGESKLLSIDGDGKVIATSSTGGGSQTLQQTLALGNTTGTYSILLANGSLSQPSLSFTTDDNTGFYTPNPGRIGVASDGLFIAGFKSNDNDVLQVRSQNGFTSSTGLYQMLSFATSGGTGKFKFNFTPDLSTLRLDRWDGSNGFQGTSIAFGTQSVSIFGEIGATAAVFNNSGIVIPSITNSFLATNSLGQIVATASPGGGSSLGSFGITIDGGGSAITTGVKGYVQVPYSGTITGWTLLADVSGSIVIDVWKDIYANFPPSVDDSIAGSEKPTLSSVQKNENNALSTWTTSVSAGDIIAFNVDSASTLTRVNLAINITKS